MLPKGLFGGISTNPHWIREIAAGVGSMLDGEEEYKHLFSPDNRSLLGCVTSTLVPSPITLSSSADGVLIGACDGLFFSRSRLRHAPHALFSDELSLPGEANGMFLCAAYDGRRLRLLSDPFGTMPLYYRKVPGGLFFSSSLKLLLSLPGLEAPELSQEGWSQFICFHTVLGGETIFEGINRILGAELLEYVLTGETVTRRRYWQPEVVPDRSKDVLPDSVDAFEQAVHRTVDIAHRPVAAALTGGFDSRTIWAVLKGMGDGIRAVTHGAAEGYDLQIARDIGRDLGIPHDIHLIGDEFLSGAEEHFRVMIRGTNGYLPADNMHIPYVYRRHLGISSTVIDGNHSSIEGRWALRNTAHRVGSREDFFEAFWRQIFRPGLAALLPSGRMRHAVEASREILRSLLPDLSTFASPGCAADVFNVTHLLPNHGTDGICLQHHFNRYLTPYLDLDYVTQVSKVPERLRWRQAPQYAVVKRHAPELLRHPRAYADVRTFPTRNPYLLRAPLLWHRKCVPWLRCLFPESIACRLDPWKPTMIYPSWYRGTLRGMLLSISGASIGLDETKSRDFVGEYLRGEIADTATISMLLTMAHPESLFSGFRTSTYG